MSETDWERLIKDTIDGGTSLTKKVFGGPNAMSAQEVLEFFQKNRAMVISTIGPSGAPHITSVGFLIFEGGIYFRIAPQSAVDRHIRRDSRVAIAVVEPPFTVNVFIEGSVRLLDEASEANLAVRAAFREKMSYDPEILGEVVPDKVFTHQA